MLKTQNFDKGDNVGTTNSSKENSFIAKKRNRVKNNMTGVILVFDTNKNYDCITNPTTKYVI